MSHITYERMWCVCQKFFLTRNNSRKSASVDTKTLVLLHLCLFKPHYPSSRLCVHKYHKDLYTFALACAFVWHSSLLESLTRLWCTAPPRVPGLMDPEALYLSIHLRDRRIHNIVCVFAE